MYLLEYHMTMNGVQVVMQYHISNRLGEKDFLQVSKMVKISRTHHRTIRGVLKRNPRKRQQNLVIPYELLLTDIDSNAVESIMDKSKGIFFDKYRLDEHQESAGGAGVLIVEFKNQEQANRFESSILSQFELNE